MALASYIRLISVVCYRFLCNSHMLIRYSINCLNKLALSGLSYYAARSIEEHVVVPEPEAYPERLVWFQALPSLCRNMMKHVALLKTRFWKRLSQTLVKHRVHGALHRDFVDLVQELDCHVVITVKQCQTQWYL